MSSVIEVKVPDIGDYQNLPVIEVVVKIGDTVDKDDPLITLESDNMMIEVPSSAAGMIKEIKTKVGDNVSEGSLILVLDALDATPVSTYSGQLS
ncbi:putative biotinylated protein [Microlunatus phosphovorus NM-1]|uniref:Putative biotinylated protein n=1 Tax=Microlunatus phosphovorus (strain ATCC 700054 / DSM 10555 / JCM 9379 / NBRC 101784 / NCIMB 13414 / VKM Ac-1990 / NM-1) TaxID=1032480 RepID=F5XR41_MICPN|nr:biotin/lipoyl-containing protein [Microlunatus phosphovorus]BAK37063.1 putative biotinylated protein [Microlunatus phosphovorus NM-1]